MSMGVGQLDQSEGESERPYNEIYASNKEGALPANGLRDTQRHQRLTQYSQYLQTIS